MSKARPFTLRRLLAGGVLCACASLAQAATESIVPSKVQENYGDWLMACVQKDGKPLCSLSQNQVDSKSQRRVLGMEVLNLEAGKATGVLLLPFGLLLGKGVTLQLDDAAPGKPRPFSTCLPGGCLVPFELDEAMLKSLRKAKTLKIAATGIGGKNVQGLNISLKGFDDAYKRALSIK